MNLSKKATHTNETKLGLTSKGTALNPNAAEFVPFALRSSSSSSSSTNTGIVDEKTKFTPTGTSGKAVLDRSESSISKNSDEEVHQYWRHQLPDDITPDFNVMNEDEPQHIGSLSLTSLSLQDDSEASIFPTLTGSGYLLNEQQDLSKYNDTTSTTNSFVENLRHASSYEEELSCASLLLAKPWEWKGLNSNQLLSKGREGAFYGVKSKHGYMNDAGEQSVLDDTGVNPMELLASHFPGFATESLGEVYFANGCDLNLTIEMLTQLELQVDGNFDQSPNSKTLPDPNLTAMDFPALPCPNDLNGSLKYTENDLHPSANRHPSSEKDNMLMFKSSSFIPSRGPTDFASAVRKLAANDSALWKYENNGSSDTTIGSSRNSHILAGAYTNGNGRNIYSDRLHSVSSRKAPLWLETGEAVANMYSEQREEARDHARLRNAYFDQASQAYLIGNKALAKELSVKGQLHNMQMKAAHGKAQESIFRHRNPVSGRDMMGNGRGSEKMIDLHGLHVSEAIHVLKHELSVLRNTARVADQRLQVYICVGTGHHTRGSRTPARLPISVQKYLLEEEGLDFSEPQPGLLRVVLY